MRIHWENQCMSRLRPGPAPRELHINSSHAIAAALNDNDDGKHGNSHHNLWTSWVPWTLVRTQVPLTSPLPFLHLGSPLAFPYTPGFPVPLYLWSCHGYSGESLHCCGPRLVMSCIRTPRGALCKLILPVLPWETGPSFAVTPSVPAAYLNPALSLLIIWCPLVARHPFAQPESKTHLALGGATYLGLTYLAHLPGS